MKTDVMPLIVGLSLCGASAALLYIWFKTRDQDEDTVDGGATTASGTPNRCRTKLECVIPNTIVPLVVGRAGANVKAIEARTRTLIRFRENNESSQVCEISGANAADVQRAAELVKQEASPPPIFTEELTVPQTACGKIIGRCGEALQEICRKSMAKVYVESGQRNGIDASQTRVIKITGTRAHVNIARALIEEKVRRDQEMRRIVDETEAKREPRGKCNNGGGLLSSASSHSSLRSSNESLPVVEATAVTPKSVKLPATGGGNDGQLEVYVSAIASPSRFWVQLVGPQTKKLDSLVETMSAYYDNEENRCLHKIADPYLGQIVTAVFKYDGKWYRAEIVGILPNEFNPRNVVLDLCFVDFGDSEYVAPHEVYELRTDFLTLRFQAIECFLANVKPALVLHQNEDVWNPEGISRFEELTHVAKWQKINARTVTTKERKYGDPRREGSPVPGVELFDLSEGNEINIGAELIREGYALERVSDVTSDAGLRLLDNGHSSDTKVGGGGGGDHQTPPVTNIVQLTEIINKNNGRERSPVPTATVPSAQQQQQQQQQRRRPHNNENNDKFTAICENTSNENYENTKIDDTRNNQSQTFIAAEQRQQQQHGLNANDHSSNSSVIKSRDGNLNDLTNTAITTQTVRPEQTA